MPPQLVGSPPTYSSKLFTTAPSAFLGRLFAPVDIATLVYFRIVFGALMLAWVLHYFVRGLIWPNYIQPSFHFTYYGFDWIQPWPNVGMYLHFVALGVLAILIMLGLWYRISMTLFFLGFAYVFLLDQSYNNAPLYLVGLISFLMILVPAHRALSIDAARRPNARADTVPAWALWALRAQIGIVYFCAGLAKLNDDWLHGYPLRIWLPRRSDFPIIGSLLTEEWVAYLFSYGGLLFDLLVVPLLLWRRTRMLAFAAAVAFHLMNWQLFHIVMFPLVMIAATVLFFPPSWPRLLGRLRRPRLGNLLRLTESRERPGHPGLESAAMDRLRPKQAVILILLALFFVLQLLVAFRHYLYPGNVLWTGEGGFFSWHMALRERDGSAMFSVTDPVSGETWQVDPKEHLTPWQVMVMSWRPDAILQFGHFIADEERKRGYEQVEVRAEVMVSLNGRKHQLLIDPTVDLAAQPRTLMPKEWIMPLVEPLPTQEQDRRATAVEASWRASIARASRSYYRTRQTANVGSWIELQEGKAGFYWET